VKGLEQSRSKVTSPTPSLHKLDRKIKTKADLEQYQEEVKNLSDDDNFELAKRLKIRIFGDLKDRVFQ
jgi:hypothetical protein